MASLIVQRNDLNLASAFMVLVQLHQQFQYDTTMDEVRSKVLVDDLERRWSQLEQPLYFLGFALFPSYKTKFLN